jgi:hypothetical protein
MSRRYRPSASSYKRFTSARKQMCSIAERTRLESSSIVKLETWADEPLSCAMTRRAEGISGGVLLR